LGWKTNRSPALFAIPLSFLVIPAKAGIQKGRRIIEIVFNRAKPTNSHSHDEAAGCLQPPAAKEGGNDNVRRFY
jgi:hypothetical protein